MDRATPSTASDESAVLADLCQDFESFEQSTQDSRELAERDRDYRNSQQWTAEEEATLKKRNQPIVTIDRIGPKVDALVGLETQHRTLPKAYPRTPAEEDGANAATDSLRYVMDDQRWDKTRSECFEFLAVEGACGVDVSVVEKYGEPCIEIRTIPWDRMWGDVHSRAKNWQDGKVKGQVIWMDLDDAVEKWPDKVASLEATMASVSTSTGQTYDDSPRIRWADPKRRRVRIVEAWKREGKRVWQTIFTKGGILERTESPYLNEDGEPEDGFVFGSCFVDREGNRFGVVRRWISIQDEINKRRSKAMHLMNVRQTYGNQGAGDKNEIRKQLARPDGHVEMQGGAKFGEDFGVLPTGDMAQAQMALLAEAKSEIDAVGANAAVLGKDTRVQSGRALEKRTEQGLAELGPLLDAHRQFQLDVYRKVWNRIRQYWTAEKWVRVTDDEKNVRFVGLNQPMTLGEQLLEEFKKQPRTPEEMQAAEQQAAMDPQMQVIVGVKNKVAELDVDITLDEVPASASTQAEQFEALTNIAPQIAQMPPAMAKVLIKASQLRNKEELLNILDGNDEKSPQVMQMQQQMQEMQQALQEAQAAAQSKQGDLEIKRMELELKSRELAIKEAEMQLRLAEAQNKPSIDLDAYRTQTELEKQAMELQYERKLFEAQKRIAILEVKAAETDMAHAAEQMTQAGEELNQAAEEAQKPTNVETVQVD